MLESVAKLLELAKLVYWKAAGLLACACKVESTLVCDPGRCFWGAELCKASLKAWIMLQIGPDRSGQDAVSNLLQSRSFHGLLVGYTLAGAFSATILSQAELIHLCAQGSFLSGTSMRVKFAP